MSRMGAEILLDPLQGGGGGGLQEMRLELEPVIAIVQPDPGRGDPLPCRDHRRMADRGHEVPVPTRLDAQNAESVLRVVEGDPLHQSCEDLCCAI